MKRITKFLAGLGCLISIVGPVIALVLYPAANWLFWLAVIGIAMLVIDFVRSKDCSPHEVGEFAERLLNGNASGLDVDDYEHMNPKDPTLRDLWQSTITIGGLPEEWVALSEEKKSELREIIQKMKWTQKPD
jgi:hypothetical protein